MRRLAIEMHRQDCFGLLCDRALDLIYIHRIRNGFDIYENRPGSGVTNGCYSSYESEGDGDDFISWSDIGCQQREVQGARAGADGNPETSIAVDGKLFLKSRDFLAQHELPALQHGSNGGIDLGFNAAVLSFQ